MAVRTLTLGDSPEQVCQDLNAAFDGTTQTDLKAGDTQKIGGKSLNEIFEDNLTTVKKATSAEDTIDYMKKIIINNWTPRNSVTTNAHEKIIWVSELGLFIVIADTGSGNRVMTSPDGINWTARTTSDHGWQDICWCKEIGVLCMVSNDELSRFMYSTDGINWNTTSTMNNGYYWHGICWSSSLGLAVAVAMDETNPIATTTNPASVAWTQRTAPNRTWRTICRSDTVGLFVAAGEHDAGVTAIMTSPNGIDWTLRSAPANINIDKLIWAEELGLFVGSGGLGHVITSTNGINWVAHTTPLTNSYVWDLCWSPELHLLVAYLINDNRVLTSPDGINWTARPFIEKTTDSRQGGICWSSDLGVFVIVMEGANPNIVTSYFYK
jgi:hypothetical protein